MVLKSNITANKSSFVNSFTTVLELGQYSMFSMYYFNKPKKMFHVLIDKD